MKRIIAIVKPNMLDDVIFALHQIDLILSAPVRERPKYYGEEHYENEKIKNLVCSDDCISQRNWVGICIELCKSA